MIFFFWTRAFSIHGLACSGPPISSSMRITASLAPPCRGPFRAPIPLVIAECRSDRVAAVTRQAKVEALSSWSACRVSATSKVRVSSSSGSLPKSMYRKFAAWLRSLRGATGSLPVRTRPMAAVIWAR